MEKEYKYWGYHLLLDAAYCDESINDSKKVENFLRELVPAIKMTPMAEPIVVYVDDCNGKGVSGMQLITTSTITFHGDDYNKCVYLDVFSCKPYKKQVVFDLFNKYFKPTKMKYRFVHRNADED